MRLAFRQLAKSPGFTAIAVLSLALGIGANTVIFSLVNDFLLRSLPVPNPQELVLFRAIQGKSGGMARSTQGNGFTDPKSGRHSTTSFALLTLERFRAANAPVAHVFGYTPFWQVHVLIENQAEQSTPVQMISGNYHAGLGVSAVLGRTLTDDDDRAAAEPVAVISHRLWQTRYGGKADVLGRVLHVNKVPVTIVGVTPPDFGGAGQVGEYFDISVPLAHYVRFEPENTGRANAWSWWIRIMARLAPGATMEQARAALEPAFQESARIGWEQSRGLDQAQAGPMPDLPSLGADPGAQGENDTRRQYTQSLRIMMGLVALVLVASCANVANLLLARATSRRREIAVRLALGASRGRLIRQLLAESLLLAALGAGLGIVLAYWGRDALLALRPFGGGNVALELPLDARVIGFTSAVAAGTALLFGLAPALRATRVDLATEFQGGTRSSAAGGRSRLSQALMVLQIALSLFLLVSTGLFLRTLQKLQTVDAGFNRHQLAVFSLNATAAGYKAPAWPGLFTRVQDRLRSLPGVRDVTYCRIALLARSRQSSSINVPGFTPAPGVSSNVNVNAVAPNFFAVMEMPIVLGRAFTERDDEPAPKVGIVNQAFVAKFIPEGSPIGRRFGWGGRGTGDVEIVGVSRDAKYTSLRDAIVPTIYVPALQGGGGTMTFYVRNVGETTALFPAIRSAIAEIDPTLPVANLRTQDEQVDRIHAQERLFAKLSGCFGILAMILACVGLYGLMSYTVARRTGEIGVRMALGAVPAQVLRMILRESLGLVILGILLGIAAAWASGKLIANLLFGLAPNDPVTYGAVAGLLLVVALFASLLPARRAARTDPMVALRSE